MGNTCVEAGCKASCCFSTRLVFKTKGDFEKWKSRGAAAFIVEGESSFNAAGALIMSRREDGDRSAFHLNVVRGEQMVDLIQLFGACPNLDLKTFNCLVRDLNIQACRGLRIGDRECDVARDRDGLAPADPAFHE